MSSSTTTSTTTSTPFQLKQLYNYAKKYGYYRFDFSNDERWEAMLKAVNAKPEKKSAGRAKSPGRGRPSKAASGSSSASGKAKMLSEGPPTEDLEGGWPEGWVRRVFERASGATKGTTDKYWYSPIEGIKLRSIVEGKVAVFFVQSKFSFPSLMSFEMPCSSAIHESTRTDQWGRN